MTRKIIEKQVSWKEYGNIVAVLTSCVHRSPWKFRPHSDVPREFTFKVSLLIATVSRLYNFGSIGNACRLSCLCRLLVAWHKGTQQFVFGMILMLVKKRPLTHFVYRPLHPLDHISIPQCNTHLVCFGIWRHRTSGLLGTIYSNALKLGIYIKFRHACVLCVHVMLFIYIDT